MDTMLVGNDFRERSQRIEDLVAQLEATADPALRAATKDLVQSVMDLYSLGLERALEIVSEAGPDSEKVMGRLGRDNLVGSLLALHGLHPDDMQTRVVRAIEKVRPSLKKNGATADLLSVEQGVVRIRIQIDTQGCGSTGATLKETIEAAVYEAAPDLTALYVEGLDEPPGTAGFVPLQALGGLPPVTPPLVKTSLLADKQDLSGETT